jgi:segregation and condensation protein A
VDNLAKILKRTEHQTIHTITRDRISVSARLHELMDFCQVRPQFTFYDALRFFPIYEKLDVVVTFLALLEMSRLKLVKIHNSRHEDLVMTIIKENFYTKHKEILDNIDLPQDPVNYDS